MKAKTAAPNRRYLEAYLVIIFLWTKKRTRGEITSAIVIMRKFTKTSPGKYFT